jgi:hypothetical protein
MARDPEKLKIGHVFAWCDPLTRTDIAARGDAFSKTLALTMNTDGLVRMVVRRRSGEGDLESIDNKSYRLDANSGVAEAVASEFIRAATALYGTGDVTCDYLEIACTSPVHAPVSFHTTRAAEVQRAETVLKHWITLAHASVEGWGVCNDDLLGRPRR